MSKPPILFFITGPIGAGKSTVAASVLPTIEGVGYEFISADLYYYLYFKKNEDTANEDYYNAKKLRDYKLQKALSQGRSFVWEAVLDANKIALVEDAKKLGYTIKGLFVGTDDPIIIVERVQNRASQEWYAIPNSKIMDRYFKMMGSLSQINALASEFAVIDSNRTGFKLVYYQHNSRVEHFDNTCLWIDGLKANNHKNFDTNF